MNYHLIYDRLIERARNRKLDGYVEKHHILPVCLGGNDDMSNLVELTPEEHYVAHQLLVKMHPRNTALVYAAHMMGNTRKGAKSYGWLRRHYAEAQSARKKGKPRPAHVILAWTNKGLPVSPETRAKMAAKKIGSKASVETREKMSRSHQMNKRYKRIALSYQIPF